MAAKVDVTGDIFKIRKMKSPKGKDWVMLEIKTGGSPAQAKDLFPASLVHFTLICNQRQFNKLQNEMQEHGLQLRAGSMIYAKCEFNIDLPMTYVDGDIGLNVFMMQSIEVNRIIRERQKAETEAAEGIAETLAET